MRSVDWQQIRKQQIRAATAIQFLIVLLTMGLLIVLDIPVRNSFFRRDSEEFSAYAGSIVGELSSYFAQSKQLAQQVPSRSRLREELVAFLEGERTYDSYVEFAYPKLVDAVEASPSILGVYRCGPDGGLLVPVDLPADHVPPAIPSEVDARVLRDTVFVDGIQSILIAARIRNGGYGTVGYDVVAVSMADMVERIASASARHRGTNVAVLVDGSDGVVVKAHTDGVAPDVLHLLEERFRGGVSVSGSQRESIEAGPEGTELEMVSSYLTDGWFAVVFQDSATLHATSMDELRLFILIVIILGIVALAGSSILHLFLSRRTVADKREFNRIIAAQTKDLKLLLEEIHHRVKNDFGLMTSFVMIKEEQVSSAEAKEALDDVRNQLAVIHSVYERLQTSGEYGAIPLKPLIAGITAEAETIMQSNGKLIVVDIHDISVKRQAAIHIGIVTNELLSNAAKYEERGAEVSLTLQGGEEGGVSIVFTSDRGAFPQDVLAGSYGFGLSLIGALADQYGGALELTNDTGIRIVITMPEVERIVPEGSVPSR